MPECTLMICEVNILKNNFETMLNFLLHPTKNGIKPKITKMVPKIPSIFI